MAKFDNVQGEFTDEGAEMWNNLSNEAFFEQLEAKSRQAIGKRIRNDDRLSKLEAEMALLKLELAVLRQNSELVLDQCKKQMLYLIEQDEFERANIQKVVGFVHKNFAMRLTRILNGLPAIETTENVSYNIDEIKL